MNGFILSAGFGSRLRPLTEFIPKALVTVCGKTLLERSADLLRNGGIEQIAVNTHYKHEMVKEWLKDNEQNIRIFNESDEILGTGGALRYAREFLESGDVFVVKNADIVTDIDIKVFVDKFIESGAMGALAAVPAGKQGTLVYDDKTQTYISTRAKQDLKPGRSCADFIGIAAYRKEFLDYVKERDFSVISSWHNVLKDKEAVKVLLFPDIFWYDCGSLKHLAQIHFDCIEKRADISIPESYIHDSKRKCVYPDGFNLSSLKNTGKNVWFDSSGAAEVKFIENSVVYPQSVLKKTDFYKNIIATKWGVFSFA